MSNYFITGGAGFIGTSLISKLIQDENNRITIYDNFERDSLKDTNLEENKRIRIFKSEREEGITNKSDLLYSIVGEMEGLDYIIHLAAIAGVDNVLSRPVRTMEVNMLGTYNLLNLSKAFCNGGILTEINKRYLKRFINFSTSEVYGNYTYRLGENESTVMGAVGEARWSYAVSKLAGEHMAFAYYKEYGLPVVSIRPFNIYGPGQVGEGAIQIFIKNCIMGKDIEIHGDGSSIRSWCYIDDAVDFITRCIENDKAVGNVFNMGNPEGTITTIGLAKKVRDITGAKVKIKYIPRTYSDIELRIPNIEKGKELLGFEPKVSLEEGILKTYEWFKDRI